MGMELISHQKTRRLGTEVVCAMPRGSKEVYGMRAGDSWCLRAALGNFMGHGLLLDGRVGESGSHRLLQYQPYGHQY